MTTESRIIPSAYFLENEEEGYEHLSYEPTEFLWEAKLGLGEGDRFLSWVEDWIGTEVTTSLLVFQERYKLEMLLTLFRGGPEEEQPEERLLVRRDPADGEVVAVPESQAKAWDNDEDAEFALLEDQTAEDRETVQAEA